MFYNCFPQTRTDSTRLYSSPNSPLYTHCNVMLHISCICCCLADNRCIPGRQCVQLSSNAFLLRTFHMMEIPLSTFLLTRRSRVPNYAHELMVDWSVRHPSLPSSDFVVVPSYWSEVYPAAEQMPIMNIQNFGANMLTRIFDKTWGFWDCEFPYVPTSSHTPPRPLQ